MQIDRRPELNLPDNRVSRRRFLGWVGAIATLPVVGACSPLGPISIRFEKTVTPRAIVLESPTTTPTITPRPTSEVLESGQRQGKQQ